MQMLIDDDDDDEESIVADAVKLLLAWLVGVITGASLILVILEIL